MHKTDGYPREKLMLLIRAQIITLYFQQMIIQFLSEICYTQAVFNNET